MRTWPYLRYWFFRIPICVLKKLWAFSDISKCSMSIPFRYLYGIFRQIRSEIGHHREITFSVLLSTFLKELQNGLFLDNLVSPWFIKSYHLWFIDRVFWKLVRFIHLASTRSGLNLFVWWFGFINLRSWIFRIRYVDGTCHFDLGLIAISHRSMHWMTVLWFLKGLFLFNFTHDGFFFKTWFKYRHVYHIANHLQLWRFLLLLKLNLGFETFWNLHLWHFTRQPFILGILNIYINYPIWTLNTIFFVFIIYDCSIWFNLA